MRLYNMTELYGT